MSQITTPTAMNDAYDRGFRKGVKTVLDYAGRSADAIETHRRRQLHEGFAVAALRGLVEACTELLAARKGGHDRRAA